jgi:DnaJ-like protein
MTERKPLGTNFESWIEAQIHHAMEEGAFDNLPGAGKPLGQDYDPDWWVKQLMQREGVSTMLPPSLELVRKMRAELAAIQKLDDEATVRRLIVALNAEIAKVNATVVEGPPTRLATLDVDQVVARWQQARSANPH